MSVQPTLAPKVILVLILLVVGVAPVERLVTFGIQTPLFVRTMTNVPLVSARLHRTASTLTVHTLVLVQTDTWTRMVTDMFASGPSTPSTTRGCRRSPSPTCISSHMIQTRTVPTAT